MKKIILSVVMALAFGFGCFADDFEPSYDSETHYIQNFADWGEYEVYCALNGLEPSYDDFEMLGNHCDFDAINYEIELAKANAEVQTIIDSCN